MGIELFEDSKDDMFALSHIPKTKIVHAISGWSAYLYATHIKFPGLFIRLLGCSCWLSAARTASLQL